MTRDERLAFYDSGDTMRHGFGEIGEDRSALEALSDALPRDALVVEVGCGTCRLADLHPGWLGMDLGHATLTSAAPGRAVQADACAIPLPDGCAALIFSLQTLEHMPEPERALAEMVRVLAPGGTLYLHPAWYCSPWAMHPLRLPESTAGSTALSIRRAALKVRYHRAARAPRVLIHKATGELRARRRKGPRRLPFVPLEPRLDRYLVSDSDASSGLEPADVARWLRDRGLMLETYVSPRERLLRIRGPVIARRLGPAAAAGGWARTPMGHLCCPRCRTALAATDGGVLGCTDGHRYPVDGGVPRLIEAHRRV